MCIYIYAYIYIYKFVHLYIYTCIYEPKVRGGEPAVEEDSAPADASYQAILGFKV